MEMFRTFTEKADIDYLVELEVKGGNKLHEFYVATKDLLEKRRELVDRWWNQKTGDMRADLVAHAAAWVLDAGRLDEDDKKRLDKEYDDWQKMMWTLSKRIDSHSEEVVQLRQKLLSLGIPGNSAGRLSLHWDNEVKKREGGSR